VPTVLVPAARLARWVENFCRDREGTVLGVVEGGLRGQATDGSWFTARLPFERVYAGPAEAASFAAAAGAPEDWGVLLVRRGGFAVARVSGERVTAHKVGRRHVQGRTKAGGQSQQRFARRRQNQARAAFDAAAEHAERLLGGLGVPVVAGGSRDAVDAVLRSPGLQGLEVVRPWLDVPDPRRDVLDRAVRDATAVQVRVHNG